jgi:hypothetical protein
MTGAMRLHSPFQPRIERSRCELLKNSKANSREVKFVARLNRESSQHPVVTHGRSPTATRLYRSSVLDPGRIERCKSIIGCWLTAIDP